MLKLFNPKTRSRLWSVVLAAMGAGGLLTYLLVANRSPDPIEVSTLTVERGTVETTVNESGVVMLRNQQTLTSPTEGGVDQVFVQSGDRVEAGQVLLTLRYPERQTALAEQQVKIQQQQRLLERYQRQIAEYQEQLQADEQELQELTDGAEEGAIARQQVYEQEDKIREVRLSLQDAQTDARTTALELETLQLEGQRIQQELNDSIITSPMDGVVLGVDVKNGDGVEFRTNLVTIGDPSQVFVKLELPTLTASQVNVNQPVRVSVIGPNAQTFTGRIQSLYPMAALPADGTGQDSSGDSEQPTVPAMVRLDTPTQTLIPGSRVNVEIVLEQRQNVVALNTEAIQRSESTPFVWVKDEQGTAEKRAIDLGLEGLTRVEVTSGLQPGEQVILPSGESPLEPGTPVEGKDEGEEE